MAKVVRFEPPAELLERRLDEVTELWLTELHKIAPQDHLTPEEARDFVSAAATALTSQDIQPLLSTCKLDELGAAFGISFDVQLGTAIGRLQVLRRALMRANDDPSDAAETAIADAIDSVIKRVATQSTQILRKKVSNADSTVGARGASLSVTLHELRRPLTIMSSYAQLLASGALGPMPESATVALEGITASTESMISLVNALSEVSRLEDPEDAFHLEELTVGELVRGAVDQVNSEAELGQTGVVSDLPDLHVMGDRRRLILAITNLVSNAIKHSPQGSNVKIRAWGDGDQVHIAVSDKGTGFPEQDAPRLFEKYFRSHTDRQKGIPGTGLGLYIVKTIIDRHGGTVSAHSRLGHGAEFEITLAQR
jgi:signal transduction histidine kinase